MNIHTKRFITIGTGLALAASVAVPAFAQDVQVNASANLGGGWQGQGRSAMAPGHSGQPGQDGRGLGMMGGQRPAAMGTVTAISGNSITIASHQGFGSTTSTTTYIVDASNATVKKNNATSSVSAIVVGDRIAVQGTVSGTSVIATTIFDGIGPMMGGRGDGAGKNPRPGTASSTPPFVGNGQPVVAGSVTAVSGNTLTVTTATNVVYTVDATNAKILQVSNTVALSSVTVGEKVVVQGAINGTSVVATTVIDQKAPQNTPQGGEQGQGQENGQGKPQSFFGNIGGFFKHLFGF